MTDFCAARLSDHARRAMARHAVSEAQLREVQGATAGGGHEFFD
jgi:hypothetical protein